MFFELRVCKLNNNLNMTELVGTNIRVLYNRYLIIVTLSGINVTLNNNERSELFVLPDGVTSNAERYLNVPILGTSWYPINKFAYFNFSANNAKPIIRFDNSTTNVSNVTIVGSFVFPRGFFNIMNI